MKECFFRVYYEDTDAGGVMYHARYLHFFERARTEYLRNIGFEQKKLLQEKQLAFVVRSMNIDYNIPARLDDEIKVVTEIEQVRGASIIFSQSLWREQEYLSNAVVKVAAVDLNRMKVIALPQEIHDALN